MNINNLHRKLVEKGLWTEPPEHVRMQTYDILIETSKDKNWTPPSLELLESVRAECEFEDYQNRALNEILLRAKQARANVLTNDMIADAFLGFYTTTQITKMKTFAEAIKMEYKRLKGLIERAKTKQNIDTIIKSMNYRTDWKV